MELGLHTLVLVAITLLSFDVHFSTVLYPYVPLGVMLVMIVRTETPGAIVLPWALAPIAIWQTTLGHGPFALLTRSAFGTVLAVQLYGLMAIISAWLIAAVLAERATAIDALTDANDRLEHRVDERTALLAYATRMAEVGANVSEALAEAGMDETATVEDIARHLADAFDSACIVALASEDGTVFVPRAAHASDPALQAATWRAFSPMRFDRTTGGLTGRAVSSGHTVRAGGDPEQLAAVCNPAFRELIVELGIRAAAVVAVHNCGKMVGTITMVRTSHADYDDTETRLLEDLAARAGLAIDNARLHAEVAANEERFRAAFDDGPLGMALVDLEPPRSGTILKTNDALSQLSGYREQELLGQDLSMLFAAADFDTQIRSRNEGVQQGARTPTVCEIPLVRADHATLWARYSQSVVWHESHPAYAVVLLEDITAIKHAENALLRRALHDQLTGLANRELLADHLNLALQQLERAPGAVAVLYLDLDRFKDVNDTLGHEVGDQLLRAVGGRLAGAVRGPDTAARIGGDEFVVVCPGIADEIDAAGIAARLEDALAEPFELGGRQIDVGASIGVSTTRTGAIDPEELIRRADLAMYQAKKAGRHRWAIYDGTGDETPRRRHAAERDLRMALDEQWLRLHYQPVIDLESERIVGVEALLRIEHPERGLLTPDKFIDVAEESDLILPIGDWVLDETCRQLAQWQPYGRLVGAVNVSGRQVATHRVTDLVLAAAAAHGIEPTSLALEMTERVLIETADETLDDLNRLTAHGVGLAIDDFGTGYSSLTYLNRLPVDTVKIDRSFIAGLGRRDRDTAIVEAIAGLARTLDLISIAEGVETPEQLEALRSLGCTRAQGFHLGRPMPAEDVTRLLASQSELAAPEVPRIR